MGVGVPGKLQSAAEVAAACVSLAVRLGARVALVWMDEGGEPRTVEVRRGTELQLVLSALEGLRVHSVDPVASSAASSAGPSAGGLESHLEGPRAMLPGLVRRAGGAGRVVLLGDFLDVEQGPLLRALGGRRRVHLGQVLSPDEWGPTQGTTWVNPETGERRGDGQARALSGYHQRLDQFLEGWAAHAQAHGMAHAAWSSGDSFEDFLPGLLR